jgi:enediyne biosynthesis protein E3
MTTLTERLRLRILGIDEEEASLDHHGFTAIDARARDQLETVGRTFARGYQEALHEPAAAPLAARLDAVEPEFRGFAYEGATTALTVLDALLPTRRRLAPFLRGPGYPYAWIAPIGFGWARAHLGRRPHGPHALVDPLLDWLVLDGAGFHDGWYGPERHIEQRRLPRGIAGPATRVYDAGIGRSLWFVRGADVERIAQTIGSFPSSRQPQLWGGVASAATYAGGVGDDALRAMSELAGRWAPDVAQGVAFAAKARLAGGHVPPHTERACALACGMSAVDAARHVDVALEGLQLGEHETFFDAWRMRVRGRLADATEGTVPRLVRAL